MPGPDHIAGIYEKAYAATEATYGTPALAYPVGTDAFLIEAASLNTTTNPFNRVDKIGSPAPVFGGENKKSVAGSINKYMLPSGTPGTVPDDDVLYTSGGWSRTAAAAGGTDDGASSTTLIVDAAHVLVAGDFIVFSLPGATPPLQMRRVVSVNAGVNFTVSPGFTRAPTVGETYTVCLRYDINLSRDDNQDSLTLHLVGNRRAARGAGVAPTKFTFEMGGDGGVLSTIELMAYRLREFVSTGLDGAITDVATAAPIHNAEAVASATGIAASVADPQYAQIDDEIITITAGGGTTSLTITRGALASANVLHDDDDEVEPYGPAQTTAGAVVPPTGGELYVDGELLHLETANLEVPMGISAQAPHFGDPWTANGYKFDFNQLAPVATIEASADAGADRSGKRALYLWAETLQTRAAVEVFMYQGVAAGSMFGFRLPSARLMTPEISGAEDEVTLSMVFNGMTDGSLTTPVQLIIG